MRPNMMVGTICLISAAAFAACQPSQPLDADPEPLTIDARPAAPNATPSTGAPKRAALKAGAKTPAVSNAVASMDAAHASAPARELRIVERRNRRGVRRNNDHRMPGDAHDGMFQLKDNDGEHAPKARSWKSASSRGFREHHVSTPAPPEAGIARRYRVSAVGKLTDRKCRLARCARPPNTATEK